MTPRIMRSISKGKPASKTAKTPPRIKRKGIFKKSTLPTKVSKSITKKIPKSISKKLSKPKKNIPIVLKVAIKKINPRKGIQGRLEIRNVKKPRPINIQTMPVLRTRTKKDGNTSKVKDQLIKHATLAEKYLNKYSTLQMKDILGKNDQGVTGTREELAKRLAIGAMIGKIPRCPKCFGGRLRFNVETGFFNCPGFMDDTKFRFCNKTFPLNEVKICPFIF